MNAIEEAESYQRLMNDLGLTQQKVAERLGKSRPYIANMLRLLNLPSDIAKLVRGIACQVPMDVLYLH